MELQFTANTIAQRKPTLVDLSELEYIASLGLRMLITAAKALLRHGLKLVLLGPQLHVEEVFRSTGFDQLMPVESTEEQALTHFQS
jgi:anti-anti-sigma factor